MSTCTVEQAAWSLIRLTANGNYIKLQQLATCSDAVNMQLDGGRTVLILVASYHALPSRCHRDYVRCLQLLVHAAKNIDATDDQGGDTVAHFAARADNLCLLAMLPLGVKLRANSKGRTPLVEAVELGHWRCVKHLIHLFRRRHGHRTETDKEQYLAQALQVARQTGREPLVEIIETEIQLTHKEDPYSTKIGGLSKLQKTARSQLFRLANSGTREQLLDHVTPANCDLPDGQGKTVLMHLVKSKTVDEKTLQMLVKIADPTATTVKGKDCLYYATKYNNEVAVRVLEEAGIFATTSQASEDRGGNRGQEGLGGKLEQFLKVAIEPAGAMLQELKVALSTSRGNHSRGQTDLSAPLADPPAVSDPPVADPPAASDPPVADPPAASDPPVADPPAASDPPVANPPTASDPPVANPPTASDPPVADPPTASDPPVADPPAASDPPVADPPTASDPPVAGPPAASDPPVADPPTASDPPGADPPTASDPPVADPPAASDAPVADPPAASDPPVADPPAACDPPVADPPAACDPPVPTTNSPTASSFRTASGPPILAGGAEATGTAAEAAHKIREPDNEGKTGLGNKVRRAFSGVRKRAKLSMRWLTQFERHGLSTSDMMQGICIIINIDKYPSAPSYDRKGSNHDVNRVKSLFKQLKFKVQVLENLKNDEMAANLKTIAKSDFASHSCFVCFVMGHGSGDKVFGIDGITQDTQEGFDHSLGVPIENLLSEFHANKCPGLANKPKVFVFQMCRGRQWDVQRPEGDSIGKQADTDGSETSSSSGPYCPIESDFLVYFACTRGCPAHRDLDQGSLYIRTLCDVIKELHTSKDMFGMLTEVVRRHKHSPIVEGNLRKYSVPEHRSTLSVECHLDPNRAGRK